MDEIQNIIQTIIDVDVDFDTPKSLGLSSIKKTFKIKVAGCTLKSVKKSGTFNVQLNWSNTSGVSGYYVYRASSKNGKYSKIATITSAKTVKYTDKKAASGKTWYYKVIPYAKINGKAVAGSSSKILSIRL